MEPTLRPGDWTLGVRRPARTEIGDIVVGSTGGPSRHPVRARVEQLHGFSAHADREELLAWLKACAPPPRHIFVTHGEEATALAFAAFVQEKTGWSAIAPAYNQREVLA